jgi:hypothetical protein
MPGVYTRERFSMIRLQVRELREIFEWIADKTEEIYGGEIQLGVDFYRVPLGLNWFFDLDKESNGEAFGSFADEIDLIRKSVLSGNHDLPDVIMERTGYLLLYLAYERARAAESS